MSASLHALWRRRWIRFVLAGGLNTTFSYGVYVLLLWLGLHYSLAYFCAVALGVGFSYGTHGMVVFGRVGWRRFARYVVGWGAIYGLNVALIRMLTEWGWSAYLAGALTVLPCAILSYFVQRYFVFRDCAHAGQNRRAGSGTESR